MPPRSPVAGLFALALLTPFVPVSSQASPPARGVVGLAETCVDALGPSGSDGSWSVNPGAGVVQPLGPIAGNIASFAFDFMPTGIDPRFPTNALYAWDAALQARDTTTIPLRAGFPFTSTDGERYTVIFSPPIVRLCAPGVADPPGADLAFDMSCARHSTTTIGLLMAFDGPSDVPALLQYTIGGPFAPVPTAHPVSEFVICDGGDSVKDLEIAQAVMTANAPLDTSTDLAIQRFRVQVPVALRWVELALTTSATTIGPVEIYDGEGTGATPPPLLRPLGFTSLAAAGGGSARWVAGADPTLALDLEANHDYWLCVHTGHACALEARALTGGESPGFAQSIGPFYRTTTADPAWQAIPDRALSFRVIGVPLPTAGVPLAARTNAGPRLEVAPNPARGAVTVRWSGAAGALRLDLFDPRGRRVASAEGGGDGAGVWRWSGLDQTGHALPAGVYFVRGRDGAGHVASARVVRIR